MLEQHVVTLESALRQLSPSLDVDNLTSLNIQSISVSNEVAARYEDIQNSME